MDTSETLLAGAGGGDPDARNRMVEIYSPIVYGWCRKSRVDPDVAKDLAQDVIITAINKLALFARGLPGTSFRGWLKTIAKRKIVDHHRQAARHFDGVGGSANLGMVMNLADPMADAPEDEAQVSADIDEAIDSSSARVSETRQLIGALLQQMKKEVPLESWQLIWEVRAKGRPFAEVALELGITECAARQRVSHWEVKLRKRYADFFKDSPRR